jgi:ABC-type transport system substrate-binding protein
MANKKLIALVFLSIFFVLGVSGVPTYAQVDALPELSWPLWVLSWDDISVDTGTGVAVQMQAIGIDNYVTVVDDTPMYTGIYAIPRTYQTYEMSHGFVPWTQHIYERLHSENIIDWGSNCYGLDNATIDTLVENLMQAVTPSTQQAAARAIQSAVKEHIPYIPIFLSDDTHAIRKEWTNYTMKPGGIFTSFNPQTPIYMWSDVDNSTFVMAYSSDIGELNPLFYRSERSHWYDMLVYDTLITYDINMNPIPWLAESWAVSSNARQVNFTLRAGAQWHDGTSVTADDVNFTIHYYKNAPEDATYWAFMQKVTSTAIDGNTVVVNLATPEAWALNIIGDLYILPKHIREGIAADDARWDDPTNPTYHVGSGPYNFTSRTPGTSTTLDVNPTWWGPAPNIAQFRIDVVVGQDARILAMRAGTADSERYEVYGAYVNTVVAAPELDLITGLASQWDYVIGYATNLTVAGYPGLGLADYTVRKAMALAVNRQQLVNIGRLGWGTITNSVIPYDFYPTLYHSDGAWWSQDVAAANALLTAAGYIDVDGDGVREFPGVVIPPPAPNLLLIGIAGVVALIIGMVIVYLIMRMRR